MRGLFVFPRGESEMRKFLLQTQVDRAMYFTFKDFSKAHGLTVARGVEWALRNLLTQAGVKIRPLPENKEAETTVGVGAGRDDLVC